MAIRTILNIGDEMLKKPSREAKFDDKLITILEDLKETLIKADGLGLAAPQAGILRRIAVIIDDDGNFIELINPKILEFSGEVIDVEGCLSVPQKYAEVLRPKHVKIGNHKRNGDYYEFELFDMLARAACHEIDHLDGVLFVDKAIRFITDEEIAQEQKRRKKKRKKRK